MSKTNVTRLAGVLVLLVGGLGGCNNTGSLQVSLSPAAAVDAGAQWCVDGGAWQDSGAIVSSVYGESMPHVQRQLLAAEVDGGGHVTYSQLQALNEKPKAEYLLAELLDHAGVDPADPVVSISDCRRMLFGNPQAKS
jgi:hypothetical protein